MKQAAWVRILMVSNLFWPDELGGYEILAREVCNELLARGHQMCVLINTKISHDCGFGFNGGAGGVNLGLTGAIGRHIGQFDVKDYFTLNPKRKGA